MTVSSAVSTSPRAAASQAATGPPASPSRPVVFPTARPPGRVRHGRTGRPPSPAVPPRPGRRLPQLSAQPGEPRPDGRVPRRDRLSLRDEPLPHGRVRLPYVGALDPGRQRGGLRRQGRRALLRPARQPPRPQPAGRGPQHRAVQGWARRTAPSSSTCTVPSASRRSRAGRSRSSMDRGNGSANARSSSVSRSARSRTRAVRSRTVVVTGIGPRHAQSSDPGSRVSSPLSRTAPSSSRSSRRSPRHSRCSRLTVSGSRLPRRPPRPAGPSPRGAAVPGRGAAAARRSTAGRRRRGRGRRRWRRPAAGCAVHGELVDEGGRGVIEQMSVVDQQQPYGGQKLHRPVQVHRLGQQMGERGERDVPGLGRPGHPGAVGAADGFRDEPGLAAARRAGDHDAVVTCGRRAADQLEFVLPAGERPGQLQGLRVPFPSHHTYKSASTHA